MQTENEAPKNSAETPASAEATPDKVAQLEAQMAEQQKTIEALRSRIPADARTIIAKSADAHAQAPEAPAWVTSMDREAYGANYTGEVVAPASGGISAEELAKALAILKKL